MAELNMELDCALRFTRRNFHLRFDCSIENPEFIGIFGRSGSGKSTLLRLLAGLEQPASGHIRVQRHTWWSSTRNIPPHRRRVGYVFQDARLFPHLSVADNLLFGQQSHHTTNNQSHWEEVLDILELEPLLQRRPHQLSGGQQQRVAIGRALLSHPRLLLMDEPLSALDEAAKAEILPYLERIHRRQAITTFYVSHNWHEIARLADRAIILDDGAIRINGAIGQVARKLATGSTILPPHAPVNIYEARVTATDDTRKLLQVACNNTSLWLPYDAKQPRVGENIRFMLAASDIAIATQPSPNSSFLNMLPCIVRAIHPVSDASCLLELDLDGLVALSAVSYASVQQLGLRKNQQVIALIKGSRLM